MTSQNRNSYMPIVVYRGKESQEQIIKYCSHSLEAVGNLHNEYISCSEWRIKIINKIAVDCRMLNLISNSGDSDLFCDKCKCPKKEGQFFEKIYESRDIKLKCGLKVDVEKDILHCELNTFFESVEALRCAESRCKCLQKE